ncbi:MAG: Gfo/Idh/MocA family protein [Ilumatobacteraceae bacterium]
MSEPGTAPIGIGVVGYGSMARAHSHAYRALAVASPGAPPVRLVAISGRDAGAVAAAALDFGFERASGAWQAVVEDPEIALVDICTPPGHHPEVITAAAQAGKAILCEKPLAADYPAALGAVQSAERANVLAAIGFNYRRLPALALMKRLIDEGRIGTVTHMRAIWLTDEFIDPQTPFDWRFDRASGGTTIADLGAHLIDLAHWMIADISSVSAQSTTVTRERPDARTGKLRPVEVDDSSTAIVRFGDGTRGIFEMSRISALHPCDFTFEVNGDRGSVRFEYPRLNELWLGEIVDGPELYGMRRIRVEHQEHPGVPPWWPIGQGLGYDTSFVNQIDGLLASWPNGPWEPSLREGLKVQAVCDAMERSALEERWVKTAEIEEEAVAG